jgi:hypothetical protein
VEERGSDVKANEPLRDPSEIKYNVRGYTVSQLLEMRPRFQRPLIRAKVTRIVREWDPQIWTMPDVFVTPDGEFLGEGQHRIAAAKKVLGADAMITCRIIETNSPGEMFIKVNSAKTAVQQIDRFKARLEGDHDPVAVDIDELAKKHGFTIARGSQARAINGIGILQKLYDEDRESLMTTLRILDRVITMRGNEKGWVKTKVLAALFYVMHELHGDEKRLVDRLVGRSPLTVATHPTNDLRANVEEIVKLYNTGLQEKNRLQPYESRLWQKSDQ